VSSDHGPLGEPSDWTEDRPSWSIGVRPRSIDELFRQTLHDPLPTAG
jgi:hypothetical protein